MLKVENIEVSGWKAAIRGMRNPKNSWERSDSCTEGSTYCSEVCGKPTEECDKETGLCLGPNDYELMKRLASAGPVHGKFRRMIVVTMDITAPLYWWKEFDTYKVGTVANSCSTMHKIHAKEFTLDDFSHEHLLDEKNLRWGDVNPTAALEATIRALNVYRMKYIAVCGKPTEECTGLPAKDMWWQMIQLLPSSYNQKRTVLMNYEVLANIHQYRHHHKLDEWHTLCDVIEGLPYSELICLDISGQS